MQNKLTEEVLALRQKVTQLESSTSGDSSRRESVTDGGGGGGSAADTASIDSSSGVGAAASTSAASSTKEKVLIQLRRHSFIHPDQSHTCSIFPTYQSLLNSSNPNTQQHHHRSYI